MACSFSCPKSAISMKEDECGFLYPEINQELCVHCNLCTKVCPLQNTYTGADAVPDIYALQNHQKAIVSESSSGGMFSLLADWTLAQGGVIYGVSFDEGFQVRHMRADSAEKAAAFRTSKYVQSDPSHIYQTICDDLANGLTVLLTGTPCQIAGVARFLEIKHADTTSLYTCDNICHGVPSPGVWKDYLEILKSKYMDTDAQITSINMRSKRVSWKKQVMDISVSKGNLLPVLEEFSFNKIFLSLFPVRPSCFHCHYTSYKRPADFTLGDFWNVDSAGIKFDVTGGVNEVLVNTEKGRKLFVLIRENAVYQPVSKAAGWQPHLEYSARPPKKYREFWKDYKSTSDKELVLRKYMKGSLLTRMIRILSPVLRKTGLYNLAGKMYNIVLGKKG